ncbi:MAG: class I SAM-dependent methyltransferase [Oligoflexales bacterium]|nr:class I SAM-dependent methyltransferase [Oligoflexales bacterium]
MHLESTHQSSFPDSPPMESVACYQCGSLKGHPFIQAQDDLTGKSGLFQFISCESCKLVFQNPRLPTHQIKDFYDDEYIAHRKKKNWGILTPFYERAMEKHDREKSKIVQQYVKLGKNSHVLDIGCGAASFLGYLRKKFSVHTSGLDFKDLRSQATDQGADFFYGTLKEQTFKPKSFDLITMWHYLEHDYDPLGSLERCRDLMKSNGRLVIEVPRLDSLSFSVFKDRWPGLQAPQHTVLFTKDSLLAMLEKAGLELIDYLPWGAFPSYFYFFAGALFKKNKGSGVNFDRVILPYYLGQQMSRPFFAFERRLNLAMQTVICRAPLKN